MVEAQQTINDYHKKMVRQTSKESYKETIKDTSNCALIKQLYDNSTYGYTDGELQRILTKLGRPMQRCNVGARRHDINKRVGSNYIVNINGETRVSGKSGKKELVWRVNKNDIGSW